MARAARGRRRRGRWRLVRRERWMWTTGGSDHDDEPPVHARVHRVCHERDARRLRRRRTSRASTRALRIVRTGSCGRFLSMARSRRSPGDARAVILRAVSKANASSPAAAVGAIAPGPKGHPMFGMLPDFPRRPARFLVRTARDFGGVARFRAAAPLGVPGDDPPASSTCSRTTPTTTGAKTRSVEVLRETLGNGLLTTTGPSWWRNRRLAQPSFHKQRLASFAAVMAEASAECAERLRARRAPNGAYFDLVPEMSRAHAADPRTLPVRARAHRRGRRRRRRAAGRPAPHDRQARVAVAAAGHLSDAAEPPLPRGAARAGQGGAVADRTSAARAGADRGDLLSMLLAARDEDTGEGITDQQLRDEVMTLLLAGHETTAIALSWTFYLLSLHPGARRKLEEEVDAALAGRAPALEDSPRLRYTRMVLDEALRLYPPAWVVTRSRRPPPMRSAASRSRPARACWSARTSPSTIPGCGTIPRASIPSASRPTRRRAPALRLLPVRRRPAPLHRRRLRDDGGDIVLATVARRLRLDLEPGARWRWTRW